MGGKQSTYGRRGPSYGNSKQYKQRRTITSTLDEFEQESDFEPVDALSAREKDIIKRSWNKIEMDAERIGANTFGNLFKMHPSVKDEFVPFQSIDVKDDQYNSILQEHGVRVLATFGKMVRRIDEEGTIIPMLRELGTRHGAIYNAKSSLIGIVGPHFLKSIQQSLGKEWTAEVEAAYSHMFDILTFHMKQALTKASMNYRVVH